MKPLDSEHMQAEPGDIVSGRIYTRRGFQRFVLLTDATDEATNPPEAVTPFIVLAEFGERVTLKVLHRGGATALEKDADLPAPEDGD